MDELPEKQIEKLRDELEERLIARIKKWFQGWRALVAVVVYLATLGGASSLTWKLFDESVASRYADLHTDARTAIRDVRDKLVALNAVSTSVKDVDSRRESALAQINKAVEEAGKKVRDESQATTKRLTTAEESLKEKFDELKAKVARIDDAQRALETSFRDGTRQNAETASRLETEIQQTREELRRTQNAVNPFDGVAVKDLRKLISLDPFDIRINALRALGRKYDLASEAFAEVVALADSAAEAEIKRLAWDTASAVFRNSPPFLEQCLKVVVKGDDSSEEITTLLVTKLNTDELKRSSVEHFSKFMRNARSMEAKGRLVRSMGRIFRANDTTAVQALRSSFSGLFWADLSELLLRKGAQNRTIELALCIGDSPGRTEALKQALSSRLTFPFALDIIARMKSVPTVLVDTIKSKMSDFEIHRSKAERVLAEIETS